MEKKLCIQSYLALFECCDQMNWADPCRPYQAQTKEANHEDIDISSVHGYLHKIVYTFMGN
jgi:hypothetical protein